MNKNNNYRERVETNPTPIPISSMLLSIKREELIIQPDFQREYVWNRNEEKHELMRSIFLKYPIGVITIHKKSVDGKSKDEIVDGLQRIRTINSFQNDEKDYNKISSEVSDNIIIQYWSEIKKDAEFNDSNAKKIITNVNKHQKIRLTYKNLPVCLKDVFDRYPIAVNTIQNTSEDNIRGFFRVLQNQERLKAGEIISSISDNSTLLILRDFENLDKNLNSIRFNNKRRDLEKYIILFHGIKAEKIKLGTTDKQIIRYAENIEDSPDFNERLKFMIKNFNELDINSNTLFTDRTFNKFSMKLLIALYILRPEYTRKEKMIDIIQKLYYFSELNSRHNSINKDRKQKIPSSYKKRVEEISIISKTSHSNKILKEKLDVLVQLFNTFDIKKIQKKYKKENIIK